MKILYISVHEILEYDELRIFTELGHEVFSLHGAYQDPRTESSKRPAIPDMHFSKYSRAMELGLQCTREKMLPELLDLFDVTIFMHMPLWVLSNWPNLHGRRVIFRSIGQNVDSSEALLEPARRGGLEIVRYSPAEALIPGFVGADAIIRFGKDPDEYTGWTGGSGTAINFTQSLAQRGTHCGYQVLDQVANSLPQFRLYGPGNEGLSYSAGMVSDEHQRKILQQAEVYLYTGTHPASYTLGFMEAMMTGVPMIVADGNIGHPFMSGYNQATYEVHQMINHCDTGFVAQTPGQFVEYAQFVMNNRNIAEAISQRGRERAIELFDVNKIRQQWGEYLER